MAADGWERRQERTRGKVLDAAGAIITESGLEGLTMRKLARHAGVAVATLYNQFGDRGGVLVAFVNAGLDDLVYDLDHQPSHRPIDTTRALFAAFDANFAAQPDLWRPIFSILRTAPGRHGMGGIGERVVQEIEHDLAKAAAAGLLVDGCDIERLARHVYVTRMNRIEKWATGVIDWSTYLASSALGLELTLAAVFANPTDRIATLRAVGIVRD